MCRNDGRLARVVAVRVEGERVHDRPLAPGLAVRLPISAMKRYGRVRVPLRLRVVLAARRDGAADHADLRADGLQVVVRQREQGEVRARARRTRRSRLNCGIQKRFRFGSLPMMKSSDPGNSRAIEAVKVANSAPSASRSGVVLLP